MNKFFRLLLHKPVKLLVILWKRTGGWCPDEPYLKLLYRLMMGKRLNLGNPQTFSEKLQWLKLHDHKPEYTTMVDKYAVKDYVADIIGKEYIIPTLGVWDRVEDIEWEKLPNQFVLKCTHDSGGLVICKDKSVLDKTAAVKKLKAGLKRDYYKVFREWPYKNVPKRIIAEQYLEPDPDVIDLRDYKFFCFNGQVKFFKIDFNRHIEHHANYFDVYGKLLPFGEVICPPQPEKQLDIPSNLSQMIKLAELIAIEHCFLRVDFYNNKGQILFGETTFYPSSGLGKFQPEEWDNKIGKWLKLPKK